MIGGDIFPGHHHRQRIDIDGEGRPMPGARRRQRQDAGPAADVEDRPRRQLAQGIEGQQAAPRRAVIAGAEGGAGWNAERDRSRRFGPFIFGAIDEERPAVIGGNRFTLSAAQSRTRFPRYRHLGFEHADRPGGQAQGPPDGGRIGRGFGKSQDLGLDPAFGGAPGDGGNQRLQRLGEGVGGGLGHA